MDFEIINNPQQLETLTQYLQTLEAFAFDTEFDRNHHAYGFKLCLIQIGTPRGCFLIDPYVCKELSSLWGVLANPNIQKILHDANEDLHLMHLHGCRPVNLFDTSNAAKILGFEKTGLNNVLLEMLNVVSEKGAQRSNWTLRPLTHQQMHYAANDVRHLVPLRDALKQRLEAQKRWNWFAQQMKRLEKKGYPVESREDFLTTEDRRMLSPFDQFVKNEIYKFRDYQAERLDRPAYQVMSKELLASLILNPLILNNWVKLSGVHHRLKNDQVAQQLQKVIDNATSTAQQRGLGTTVQKPTDDEYKKAHQRRSENELIKKRDFDPIRQWIVENYGVAIAPQIMSNDLVNQLIWGETKLSSMELVYQKQIIEAAGVALNIDLTLYS